MTKRYFRILARIDLETADGEPLRTADGTVATATHVEFLRSRTMDGVFGKDMAGAVISREIRTELKGKSEGDIVILDEDAWLLLVEAIKRPQTLFYNTEVAPQIVPFMRAVVDASAEAPTRLISQNAAE